MLSKSKRIPRKTFSCLAKNAKTLRNRLFLLRFVSLTGQKKKSRFCFSVSKKIAKSAVVRNRLRRFGYKILEKYIPDIKPNTLILFSFREIPPKEEEISESIESILKASKLIE